MRREFAGQPSTSTLTWLAVGGEDCQRCGAAGSMPELALLGGEIMDERKANILRTVVEEYIATAQPVGSGHVAASPDVAVSSATVRNDMAALEQEGYLAQPHTSAGRVPTDKGYRYFVDHLGRRARLAPGDAQQVRQFFADAHGELEVMLAETTRLLAGLTRHTAVVVGPPHGRAVVRSVQLVGLSDKVVLLVVVLSNGVIAKHVVEVESEPSDDDLAAAGRLLADVLVDHGLDDGFVAVAERVDGDARQQIDVGAALRVGDGRALAGDELDRRGAVAVHQQLQHGVLGDVGKARRHQRPR